jgi:hypothetical protein
VGITGRALRQVLRPRTLLAFKLDALLAKMIDKSIKHDKLVVQFAPGRKAAVMTDAKPFGFATLGKMPRVFAQLCTGTLSVKLMIQTTQFKLNAIKPGRVWSARQANSRLLMRRSRRQNNENPRHR